MLPMKLNTSIIWWKYRDLHEYGFQSSTKPYLLLLLLVLLLLYTIVRIDRVKQFSSFGNCNNISFGCQFLWKAINKNTVYCSYQQPPIVNVRCDYANYHRSQLKIIKLPHSHQHNASSHTATHSSCKLSYAIPIFNHIMNN